ncbi:hypothetical protein SAMN05444274_10642 [Mariniphaga anaerophila]|uniref:Uncharacterized protein n=1 Tax=Mariniphaga anaerophila TaxID=1484053 RepID=A0A1M5CBJ8_9BACT|nr:hypothetical protein [Mariniphaga anaerophila]SHF52108.1 hypothetical protein SAMN05444274_10642 [Mariniphaga anaerophila]
MKIEHTFINFRCFLLCKYLIILSIIVFNVSCEKEPIFFEEEDIEDIKTERYSFRDYSFIDGIKCYDAKGNTLDSLSYMYSPDDFVFFDEFEFPYEKIEIKGDSTVSYYCITGDTTTIRNGNVTQVNDTLCFYFNELGSSGLLFKGLIVDNQIRISGYGCRYYIFTSDGSNTGEIADKIVELKIPDLEYLLKTSPQLHFDNHIITIHNLYIQRFDLVYEIETE